MKDNQVFKKDIAKILKRIRDERHLTQKEIANIMGVSDRTISKWENGDSKPDLESITNLCNNLGVSPKLLINSTASVKDYIHKFLRVLSKVLKFIFRNSLIITFFILFLVLLFYFLNNYNEVNLYMIKYESDNISINYSYYINTKNLKSLIINDISLNKIDYDIKTTSLNLYTYFKADKYIIYSSNNLDNIYIEELKNNTDILTADIFNNLKEGMYLEITTTDEDNNEYTYTANLFLVNEFSNDLNNSTDISYNYDNEYKKYLNLAEDKNLTIALGKLGYVYDTSNNYYKGTDEYGAEITFYTETNKLYYLMNIESEKLSFYLSSDDKTIKALVYKNNQSSLFRCSKDKNEIPKSTENNCILYKNYIYHFLDIYADIMAIPRT